MGLTPRFAVSFLAALSAGFSFGQTEPGGPAFDLAAVHPSPRSQRPSTQPPKMSASLIQPGVYQLKTAALLDLISTAYGTDGDKIAGGPSWLDLDRFDIVAKGPVGAPPDAVRGMIRSLLRDRFGLAVHQDKRPMPGYALSPGKGAPKMQRADGSGPSGCRRAAPTEPEANAIECRAISMASFAQQLRAMAGDYFPAAVLDETKLDGEWDFSLEWTPRAGLAAAAGASIFDAIQSQLGLRLDPKQVDTSVLVVDRVNRTPTPDPPGAASLPVPPSPAFEVAAIKPSQAEPRISTPPNGQVTLQGLTLGFLIQTIWFVTPDMILNAPKWLDTERWDITAKIASAPGSAPQTDLDSLITMVRALLEDRFQLKTHMQTRVVPAYTLTASKPKLQRADPLGRTGCKEGPGAGQKDPRLTHPALSRLAACSNITMAQFAELLPSVANALSPPSGGYLHSAVADATRLDGAYDFTLNFSPWSMMQAGPGPAAGNVPSDPNGPVSLFDAIQEQLGLKLELTRRPAPVLVIDHIERQPSGN